jgi:hypothetical protein
MKSKLNIAAVGVAALTIFASAIAPASAQTANRHYARGSLYGPYEASPYNPRGGGIRAVFGIQRDPNAFQGSAGAAYQLFGGQ